MAVSEACSLLLCRRSFFFFFSHSTASICFCCVSFYFLFFHSFVVTALLCIPRAKRVVAIHQSDDYALSSFLFNLNLISLKKERKKKSDFFSPFDLYLNKLHNTRYLHANVIVYLMNSVKCRARQVDVFGKVPGFVFH